MGYVEIGLRALFVTVFAASFVSKTGGFDAFAGSVRGMVPAAGQLARPIAWVVFAFEAAVCLLLVLPAHTTAATGFLLASTLLLAFTLGIAATLRRGARVPCRCFGDTSTPVGPIHLVRNLLLVVVALAGAGATTAAERQLPIPVMLLCAAAGVLLGAIVIELDAIVRLFRPVRVPSKT